MRLAPLAALGVDEFIIADARAAPSRATATSGRATQRRSGALDFGRCASWAHVSRMRLPHYLRPLLVPDSVAVVGASARPATIGRVVMENLLDGYQGEIYLVNPGHRKVLNRRCHASLRAIGKPV